MKGHGFIRADKANRMIGLYSPRRAEKLILAVNRGGIVSGRDFSRADKANRMMRALQAAEKLFLSMSLWRHLFSTGVWFMKEVCVEKTKSSLRCTAM